MSKQNIISLACGVMPGATPLATVEAAANAGFDAVGLWVEPAEWTAGTTRDVLAALRNSGLPVLDVEVVWIRPGPLNPDHLRVIDIGGELGAANVLVVSSDPDMGATADKFAQLCEHAATMGIRVALEFGAFTDLPTMQHAATILRRVDHPSAAMLVDALHLYRSGGDPSQLADIPTEWLTYFQLCDAARTGPAISDRAGIREEALDRRVCPGEGELALARLMDALPKGIPISVEIRSKHLRDTFVDPVERARYVADATRRWMAQLP